MSFLRPSRPRQTEYDSVGLKKSRSQLKSIPALDGKLQNVKFISRHRLDAKYRQPHFDATDDSCYLKRVYRHSENSDNEPSYTKFKVPFQMICQQSYKTAVKNYELQFSNEICNLINNQPTAREATYFVRIISFTTLWPPYHNERELTDTSRRFYSLSPKEKSRLNYIMSQDYS